METPRLIERRAKRPIRVFLVDDSPIALVMLKRFIATSPEIEIVGTARDGVEALASFERAQPDVICTDYLMPNMDGLALIQRAMEEFPRPILVVSSTIDPQESHRAFPLLQAGAVDVFAKPTATAPFEQSAAELVQKIKLLSSIRVIRHYAANATRAVPTQVDVVPKPYAAPQLSSPNLPVMPEGKTKLIRLVAVGASTGGPQVLQSIFSELPKDFPCPILCVQHISRGFLAGLVDWLDSQCRVRVKIAVHGELALPGTIYFPQEDTHLEVDKHRRLLCAQLPPVGGHRPSVTTTFESVARHYGHSSMGILLTGMGSDGAAGLDSMRRAGATTWAQDEASCVVFGMPRQAIALGAAQAVLSPTQIARGLIRLTITP